MAADGSYEAGGGGGGGAGDGSHGYPVLDSADPMYHHKAAYTARRLLPVVLTLHRRSVPICQHSCWCCILGVC